MMVFKHRWAVASYPLAFAAFVVLSGSAAVGQERSSFNTGYFGNVAILGYDPVAYFTDGRAVKGSPDISQSWLGTTWHFASTAHRDAFVAEPMRYAPQYGGFCAGSMSIGLITDNIDPKNGWRIIDGKLYLFGGSGGLDQDFDPDATKILADATTHWPDVKKKVLGQ
jgi:hypothetical protein